jgi:hypothetical protein
MHTYVCTLEQTLAWVGGAAAQVEEGITQHLTAVGLTPCTVVILLADGSVASTLEIEEGTL